MRKPFYSRFFRTTWAVAAFFCMVPHGFTAEWKVKDAPYRAIFRLTSSGNDLQAGVEIELPDFGAHRDDLGDALLMNSDDKQVPLVPVWHAVGKKALFIAQEMKPGMDYFLYFGGKFSHSSIGWSPKQGLLLETRSLGARPKINTETEMLDTWNNGAKVNGFSYVESIKTNGNPFGESTNYASHYTGLFRTKAGEELTFYTLSSDASFVFADGRPFVKWPGIHDAGGDEKSVHKGTVTAVSDTIKIDYYQAKVSSGMGACALGMINGRSYKLVSPEDWVHPGESRLEKIEQVNGLPVPYSSIKFNSYIGYGGYWLYDVTFDAPSDVPEGWYPEWHFSDGSVISGKQCERIMPLAPSLYVSLVYRKGNTLIQGIAQVSFPEDLDAASVKNPDDLGRYLSLLSVEKPQVLPIISIEPLLPLLLEYATNEINGRFATAWLLKSPQSTNPLWINSLLSTIRSTAQTDPGKALLQLRDIDFGMRKQHLKEISMLELELLVFYLRDPSVLSIAHRVEFDLSGTPEAQLASIRVGDYYRLVDQPEKAETQYASVQKQIPDATGGRKLPAMDRSYSITVDNLLANGMRHEADEKLREWELVHPLCKRDSDFLLLQARMLNSFGYWSQALAELDSFKKTHLDSPYEITADFYRAESLNGLGKHDEARKIWSDIVKNYPRNELADQCRQLLSKP